MDTTEHAFLKRLKSCHRNALRKKQPRLAAFFARSIASLLGGKYETQPSVPMSRKPLGWIGHPDLPPLSSFAHGVGADADCRKKRHSRAPIPVDRRLI